MHTSIETGIFAGTLLIVDVSTQNFDNLRRTLMFDHKSDYALNKLNPDAIVDLLRKKGTMVK